MELLRDKIKRDTYMVSKVCNMIARGDLRDNHPQQRKSGQWSKETRDNFIVTAIKNEDFDPIKICEQLTEKGVVLWLIDGLQRSTTIENYKSGRFKLGRNINPSHIEYQEATRDEEGNITYQNVTYDLRGKAYKDLPEKLKEDFDNCPVDVVKHLDCTDEEVGRHITRYNSGQSMNPAQKIVAYMCNVAKHVKRLANHSFFNDCAIYSEKKDLNGDIDKTVSEIVMGINFFESWKSKDAKKIGKFLNENATEDMFNKVENYLDDLLEVVTPDVGTKLFDTKNAAISFMLYDRFKILGFSKEVFGEFLSTYETFKDVKVEVKREYKIKKGSDEKTNVISFAQINDCNSTKDKGIMEDKLHILETVMNNYLHINKEETNEEVILVTEENESIEVDYKEFVKANVEDIIDSDIYEVQMVANDVSEVLDSEHWMLSKQNYPAYLAIVGMAFRVELEDKLKEWLPIYVKNNEFMLNQQKAFLHMKDSFEKYIQEGVV